MKIDNLVLHAYEELQIIDEEIEDKKYPQAIERSDNLLRLIVNNKPYVESHINYPLIKRDLEIIEGELKISRNLAGIRGFLEYPPNSQTHPYSYE